MENTKRIIQTSNALKLSIATGATLFILKFAAGIATHSMAVMASALDSAMDVGVSTVNLIAARQAAKPPDEDHAYGHGKIESLAALFQSLFISVSGIYIVFESVKRLILGSFVKDVPAGIIVMIFSIVATFLLVWRLRVVQKRSHSMILATEELHFNTDILSNGGVIAALFLVRITGLIFWDLVISMLVAGTIFRASYRILRRAIDELLDRSLPPVPKEKIEKLILEHHNSIVGLHNFRSRQVGHQMFLDFHIEIRGEEDFKKAHLMTESLIRKIQDKYPESDVTVHYDPEGEM
ncbi:MAG: cation transporter [Candidatus Omnitrophica bacterium]|nr:cation transporter [Candidatus Omnitrophota bacterium]